MRRRLAIIKYFAPSITLLGVAMLAILFTHSHIVVPIILVVGAVIMAWQNYRVIKDKVEVEVKEVE